MVTSPDSLLLHHLTLCRRHPLPPPHRPPPPPPFSSSSLPPPPPLRRPQSPHPPPLRRHVRRLLPLRRPVLPSSLSLLLLKTPPILPRGPLFFWAYVYYLSKLYEFIDTLLIILSDTADRRLTFLHVYHHAVVVVMAYVWLAARQSLMPIALVTNASVHVIMYSYYLCCTVGLRWPARWKRAVTEMQIAQFVFSFAASVVFLWMHFAGGGEGCQGFNAWVFNAVFNASLLALFRNFHSGEYKERKKRMNAEKEA